MQTTSWSQAERKNCWNTKSNRVLKSSYENGVFNSQQRRPSSRILKRGSISSVKTYASTRWANSTNCLLPHPRKSETWKTKKYFTTIQGDNWVFFGTVEEHTRYLLRATNVPIVRHVKIQGEANPYDPTWESYFEKRLDVHMAATLKGKHWLLALWKEQGGL